MKKIEMLTLPGGRKPYLEWFENLETVIQQRIDAYIKRVAFSGARKNIRALGDGIYEIKVKLGPGYRVYFGEVGNVILLLLVGGDKRSQFRDIITARKYWREYVQKG